MHCKRCTPNVHARPTFEGPAGGADLHHGHHRPDGSRLAGVYGTVYVHILQVAIRAVLDHARLLTLNSVRPPPVSSGTLTHICVRPLWFVNLQECKDADYELWSPPRPETCLLGQNYTMRRRKREASCFNSYDFDDVRTGSTSSCSTSCMFARPQAA